MFDGRPYKSVLSTRDVVGFSVACVATIFVVVAGGVGCWLSSPFCAMSAIAIMAVTATRVTAAIGENLNLLLSLGFGVSVLGVDGFISDTSLSVLRSNLFPVNWNPAVPRWIVSPFFIF